MFDDRRCRKTVRAGYNGTRRGPHVARGPPVVRPPLLYNNTALCSLNIRCPFIIYPETVVGCSGVEYTSYHPIYIYASIYNAYVTRAYIRRKNINNIYIYRNIIRLYITLLWFRAIPKKKKMNKCERAVSHNVIRVLYTYL